MKARGTDSAQVIQVIKTESMRGEGTQESSACIRVHR